VSDALAALERRIRYIADRHNPPAPLDRDDLFQEGMIAVWRLVERRRDELGEKAWTTYALRRAEGAMLDAIRAARWGRRWNHDPDMAPLSLDADVSTADEQVALVDTIAGPADDVSPPIVDDVLSHLSARDRAAVKMIAEGWSQERVGEALGMSASRVSQIVRRGCISLTAA
jgi:RNA polymerase sigma factor (sigma-70 family)